MDQVHSTAQSISSPIKVLVIDDSTQIRKFLADCVLTPNGYLPIQAEDGAEGLHKILVEHPDIILMDLEMPRMNGLQVLEAMKERHIEIPTILMTAHGSEEIAVEVFRLGVRDYVIKPVEIDPMLILLDRVLAGARLRRERDELLRRLKQSNRQLDRRLQELNLLYGIGKSVAALLDQEKLLARIVDAAIIISGADVGILVLTNPATDELVQKVVREKSAASLQTVPDKLARTALYTLKTRRGAAARDVLCTPIAFGNQVMGILGCVKLDASYPFTRHDFQLLQMMADYAAIALENVRLFKELEAQKEEEKAQIRHLFERYVAPAVVERIVAAPDTAGLGGVRQPVTVLFADIRGFTALSHRLIPEILIEVLNHHISVVAEAILKEEGTLDKFMGDAVLAFFNAPLAQSDYALRAVRAAWAMQQALADLHRRLPESYQLHFGIGLSTGEAVVGNIGTVQQMNYTVIGECVNLAQRLQAGAKGDEIFLDQRTYDIVQAHVEVEPVGLIEIKGLEPEPAFRLVGFK